MTDTSINPARIVTPSGAELGTQLAKQYTAARTAARELRNITDASHSTFDRGYS